MLREIPERQNIYYIRTFVVHINKKKAKAEYGKWQIFFFFLVRIIWQIILFFNNFYNYISVHIYHIKQAWVLISAWNIIRIKQTGEKLKGKRIEIAYHRMVKGTVNFSFLSLFRFSLCILTMPQKIRKPWGKKLIQRISWSSATYLMIYYSNTSVVLLVPLLHSPTCRPYSRQSCHKYLPISTFLSEFRLDAQLWQPTFYF